MAMSLQPTEEAGEIVKLLPQNKAKVRVKRHSACEGCKHKGFCDPLSSEHMLVEAENKVRAGIGQRVLVHFRLENQGKAILILYILPLVFLMLGAIAGTWLDPFQNKDASGSLFSLFFLVISIILIRAYHKRSVAKSDLEPQIIKVLNKEEQHTGA